MADNLETIVQRMIDAGESEENIATVIQSQRPTAEEVKSQGDQIVTGQSGGSTSAFARVGQALSSNPLIQAAAHPKDISDVLTLLLPAGVEGAVTAGKSYLSAAEEAAKTTKSLKAFPAEIYKVLRRNAKAPYPIVGFDRYAPNVSAAVTEGVEGADAIPHSVVDRYAPNVSGDVQLGNEQVAQQEVNATMILRLRDKMNAPMLAKNPQARAAIATAIKRLGGTP